MASDLISRDALLKELGESLQAVKGGTKWMMGTQQGLENAVVMVKEAPSVDAIPIATVAEMLAELFGEECCCNYNGIDEWLPFLCEYSDTCPDVIGKNGCWKQFIKHWRAKNDAIA